MGDRLSAAPLRSTEQRLHHAGSNRHRPGDRCVDLGVRSASSPRTCEATLSSRLAVAGQNDGEPDQRLRLAVKSIRVAAVCVPLLELVEEGRVVGHVRLRSGLTLRL